MDTRAAHSSSSRVLTYALHRILRTVTWYSSVRASKGQARMQPRPTSIPLEVAHFRVQVCLLQARL